MGITSGRLQARYDVGVRLQSMLVALALFGCGDGGGSSGGHDAEVRDAQVLDAFVSACAPLTGSGPFAVRMAGMGTLTKRAGGPSAQPRELPFSVDLFFPQGRTAGAQVFASRAARGLHVTSAVIASDGSAGPLRMGSSEQIYGFAIDGALEPAPGGVLAEVGIETGFNDLSEFYQGRMELCGAGEPPAPALSVKAQRWSPLAQIRIVPTTPLDPGTLATIRATAGGAEVAVRVDLALDHVLVSPVTAFPPASQVTLDLTGVRDVLARPPGSTVMFDAPPSAEVADLTFAAALPPGSAVAGPGTPQLAVANGVLDVLLDYWSGATIALGSRTGSTTVIRHKVDCGNFTAPQQRVAIVAADGSFAELPLTCGADFVDARLTVPATGPRWLAITLPLLWAGVPRPAPGKLTIDEIRFE